jgi:hypothetical protein
VTWYKALFESLIKRWQGLDKELSSSNTALALTAQSLEDAGQCAKAFSALIQVTKTHSQKQVLPLPAHCSLTEPEDMKGIGSMRSTDG